MRKVLLASSALVAAAGVSAASADVTISTWQEFGFASFSDNTSNDDDTMWNDGEIMFKFAGTTDSGLNYSVAVDMESQQTGGGSIDEASLTLSTAEMGTLVLGENDEASDSFATYLPGGRNMTTGDDGGYGIDGDGNAVGSTYGLAQSATGAAYGDANRATYLSPNLGGIKIGYSYGVREDNRKGSAGTGATEESADTSMGVSYSTEMAGASVTLRASNRDNGEDGADPSAANGSDKTDAYGISVSYGEIALGYSATSRRQGSGSTRLDTDTTGFGVGYTVNEDLSVAVNMVSSEEDRTKHSVDTTSLSVSYTIAPGLNFAVAMNTAEFDHNTDNNLDMDADSVVASIQANF